MSKIYIINGSPRKNGNTIKMCEEFKKGAESKGAEVELVNLYDLKFTGCRSCFACKRLDGKSFCKCAYPDELKPVLDGIYEADGIVFASPIYFGNITGELQSFYERLFFPFFTYNKEWKMYPPKQLETAVIYTMNVGEDWFNEAYLKESAPLYNFEGNITRTFKEPVRICAWDTLQFDDYSKYASEIFDENHKKEVHETQFPKDLEKAYKAGYEMAEKIN